MEIMLAQAACAWQSKAMKTNIDVLDNPNSDKNIQAQLVKAAIRHHENLIREWNKSWKRETRGVQKMIREYSVRLETLKAELA